MSGPLRILFHNCRLLHPLHGGDRIRTYNMLRELRQHHHITYLCLRTPADRPEALDQASEYCHELIAIDHAVKNQRSARFYLEVLWNTFFGKYPFLGQKYLSPDATQRIRELTGSSQQTKPDLLICDYLAPMVNLLELGMRPLVPALLFQHNVESVIFARHAETAKNPVKSAIYRQQWRKLRSFEQRCADFVDAQVTVSEADTETLRGKCGMENVLGAVPTGVDCEYFQPASARPSKPVLAFLGSMDWDANQEAVFWFAEKVLPEIWRKVPETEFVAIGRNPSSRLIALSASEPRIRATGTVADVRPEMQSASAMVLPLRVGGGTRIKIYEAMAMGVPVISTTIGAEGLDVKNGENILLADDAESFVRSTIDILTTPGRGAQIATAAREHVAVNYSWKRVAGIFSEYCQKAVQLGKARLAGIRGHREVERPVNG